MDHLAELPHPLHEPVKVPLLCQGLQSSGEVTLAKYPLSRGFLDDESLITYMRNLSLPVLDALAQEWLYFVLLSDVFCGLEIDFHPADFTSHDGSDMFVTTSKLPEYIDKWRVGAENESQNTRAVAAGRTWDLLTQVSLHLQRLWHTELIISPVGLSIVILCETLEKARSVIYADNNALLWPRHTLPQSRMIDQGWCANRVSMLYHNLNNTCLYMASSLKEVNKPSWSHELCSEYSCTTNNINRDIYRPRHVSPGCSCREIGPNPEELNNAIDKGTYPILRILEPLDDTRRLHLQVIPFPMHGGLEYVAISHVWSDGIGNLHANALPTCQLIRINAMASELYPDNQEHPFLWLDTLCVPYENDIKYRRRTAIGRMQHTYRDADKVLVLSSDLYGVHLPDRPEEALLRIQSTGWMRRLWTLQEGVLNQSLYFRFSNRSTSLTKLEGQIQINPANALSPLSSVAIQFTYDFAPLPQGVERVKMVYNSLQWRNTSWPSDEAICLSILLDVDTGRIAATPPEDRMSLLLALIKDLPSRLIFAPGRRLKKEGYTWAPETMRNGVGWTIPLEADRPAMQSTRGLVVTWPGVFLTVKCTSCRDVCFFKIDGEETLYRVMNLGIKEGGKSWADEGPQSVENPAIMIGTGLIEGMEDEAGALVSIETETTSGAYVARYISRVQVYKQDLGILELRMAMETMWEKESLRTDITAVLGVAEAIPETQIWYLR